MIATLLDDMLSDLGCVTVGPAYSVAAAQSLMTQRKFDAAIVDLNLGGVSAHSLIEALLEAGIPVIVATGYGSAAPNLPPACRLVSKPYALHHVEAALRAQLDG